MPELPEVETTRRGIAPHVEGRRIARVVVRDARLRQPVTRGIDKLAAGQSLHTVTRRGKYLLLACESGSLLIHLGMSGSLRRVEAGAAHGKHDHVDIEFAGGPCLRFNDPRRFGLVLWVAGAAAEHPLLRNLGPEPLARAFHGDYLHRAAAGRAVPIKSFIMDGKVVVGVGNIYANEALFAAAVDPRRAAGELSGDECRTLAVAIKRVLRRAIAQGGTTLRDFVDGDGRPGYFQQQLKVYGREGDDCTRCGAAVCCERLGQRATYFCAGCQR